MEQVIFQIPIEYTPYNVVCSLLARHGITAADDHLRIPLALNQLLCNVEPDSAVGPSDDCYASHRCYFQVTKLDSITQGFQFKFSFT